MTDKNYLSLASYFAKLASGCTKVQVGSVIVKNGCIVALGANRTDLDLCKHIGCLRVTKYGDNAKTHRNPDDCRAVHSEIDAISSSKCDLYGATIYVSRYPCEACARAIVRAGIKTVVYGRGQKISDMTARLLEEEEIEVVHVSDYIEEDVLS